MYEILFELLLIYSNGIKFIEMNILTQLFTFKRVNSRSNGYTDCLAKITIGTISRSCKQKAYEYPWLNRLNAKYISNDSSRIIDIY